MKKPVSAAILALLASASFADDRPEVELVYSGKGDTHCYEIHEHEGKRLKFLTLGKNYSATPIADTVSVEVTKHPAGWQAEVVTKSRYGHRYVEMKSGEMPERASRSDKSSRRLGEICLRLGGTVEHVEQMPYSYEVVTSSRVIAARATAGKPASAAAPEPVKDGLEKAEEVAEKVDRLKGLLDR
ncbi:MAG TPA: hypothetical protein VF267_00875 [Gammaproteobacteria bacterium]